MCEVGIRKLAHSVKSSLCHNRESWAACWRQGKQFPFNRKQPPADTGSECLDLREIWQEGVQVIHIVINTGGTSFTNPKKCCRLKKNVSVLFASCFLNLCIKGLRFKLNFSHVTAILIIIFLLALFISLVHTENAAVFPHNSSLSGPTLLITDKLKTDLASLCKWLEWLFKHWHQLEALYSQLCLNQSGFP